MIIACGGHRELIISEKLYLASIGASYAEQGHTIVSGNAPGADQAYVIGASEVDPGLVELYLPWPTFEKAKIKPGNRFWTADQAWPRHIELASAASPGWDHVAPAGRLLCIRNAMVLFRWGQPADRFIALPDRTSHGWGGTGHAMRVAASLGIPVWLADRHHYWNPLEGLPTE